jgi:gluconate kinase
MAVTEEDLNKLSEKEAKDWLRWHVEDTIIHENEDGSTNIINCSKAAANAYRELLKEVEHHRLQKMIDIVI